MKFFLGYIKRRAFFLIPQLLGVLLITFFMVRMIPGDPARMIAGGLAPEEGVQQLRERMGLTGPLYVQLARYIVTVFKGDLGKSWFTGNPVLEDIKLRLPATLELIILSLLLSFLVMLPIALRSVSGGGGILQRIAQKGLFGYGMAAGAFPDFWLALILIFFFYAVLGWLPPPTGRLRIDISPPTRITGMYLVDSLLTGNWRALGSSALQLILPVFVLSFVYGGAILKVGLVAAMQVKKSEYIDFAKVSGLPHDRIQQYIHRAVYPSVATMAAVVFGFLLGGAVLVETVFSWTGFGQYAVQSVVQSDYFAIQGVVLVSALLNLVIYMVVDMVYFFVDPRIKSLG
jgi:ABC-type dipeptide/oligopeptide/nickel transport system permease component